MYNLPERHDPDYWQSIAERERDELRYRDDQDDDLDGDDLDDDGEFDEGERYRLEMEDCLSDAELHGDDDGDWDDEEDD